MVVAVVVYERGKAMKFERIYMTSHTNKKADSTDYVDYYKAENGMVIQIVEPLNMSGRWYKVFANEDEMNKFYPFGEHFHRCFQTLKNAKEFVERFVKIEVAE